MLGIFVDGVLGVSGFVDGVSGSVVSGLSVEPGLSDGPKLSIGEQLETANTMNNAIRIFFIFPSYEILV